MIHSHTERIKELFIKLKLGYDWCQKNRHNQMGVNELFRRSEPIFEELKSLGVSRQFSVSLLIFGPLITEELLQQFEDKDDQKIPVASAQSMF